MCVCVFCQGVIGEAGERGPPGPDGNQVRFLCLHTYQSLSERLLNKLA